MLQGDLGLKKVRIIHKSEGYALVPLLHTTSD